MGDDVVPPPSLWLPLAAVEKLTGGVLFSVIVPSCKYEQAAGVLEFRLYYAVAAA